MEHRPATSSDLPEIEQAERNGSTPLARLLAGSSSSRLPYFIVPGGWNFPVFFQRMARNLADERAGYGLTYPGLLPGGSSFETVEELAQQMVAHVQQAHPTGPYLLVGHSFGGVVSIEMARILEAQSQPVGVVMIDAKLDRLRRRRPRLARLLIRGKAALEPQRIAHHVQRRIEAARRTLFPKVQTPMLERIEQVKTATLAALSRYEPRQCAAPTILIRASVPARGDRYFFEESDYGWSRRLNVIDILVAAGSHYELHRSAEGRALAFAVGSALDTLERTIVTDRAVRSVGGGGRE